MKILKYDIEIFWGKRNGVGEGSLPIGSKVLDIQVQENTLRLWALVDDKEKLNKPERFFIWGTGWEFPDKSDLKYFKTIHTNAGLVWHIFTL